MTNQRWYSSHWARGLKAFAYGTAALALLVLPEFSTDASAQNRRNRDRLQEVQEPTPAPQAEAPKPAKEAAKPVQIDPGTPFGAALVSCDKFQEEDQFGLPGLKGDVKLDRCYRGRNQLVCRFDAIIAEGKSLSDEYTRIVQERYPEVTNLEDICKIDYEALVRDAAGTAEFGKRFGVARAEYETRSSCAAKVKQTIQDVALPDLVQAPEVIKSMMEAVELDIGRVSAAQEQVSGLAAKIATSQKSIAVLQKIHRAMCFKSKPDSKEPERVSSAM